MAEEAKPTTDAELATLREMCAKPETWAVGSATALGLVARIDTERTVRLAAEARVKVLKEAARGMVAAIDDYRDKPIDDGYWKALYAAKLDLIAAIKEPANG